MSKNFICCLFILCLFLFLMLEESWAQKEFYVGLRLAPQSSFLINSADRDSGFTRTFTSGYVLGGAVGQNFTKHFGFEFSVLYSLQGQKYTRERISQGGEKVLINEQTELSYLKVPMLLRYFTPFLLEERRVYLSVHFGPQVGILLQMRQYEDSKLLPENVVYSRYIRRRDLFNPTEIHLVGAIGLEYTPSPQFLLTALIRGDYSLVDALDKTLKTPGQPNSYNATLGLILGFSYLINR
ncbi:MAG: porin family protein [Bacteroidia bacterium]|nr:PorT family protein [Bacteroidia bacterium]MDW8158975.1 porin family protein [Bacteroidia bacterium]